MSSLDERRRALGRIRRLLRRFVDGEIAVSAFLPNYRRLFGDFDPPDVCSEDMSAEERNQLYVFIELMGGWFGEHDHAISLRADWKYGDETEPYGWIDEDAYRRTIAERLAQERIDLATELSVTARTPSETT